MYRRMLRISWTEHRTNNSILEQMEPACRFLAEVKRRKLQYFGHVVRANNLCTHVLHGIVAGKRRRGRPRKRWTDDIKQWTGISVAECVQHAKDRSAWCPCQWPPILSHEDGPRQNKAQPTPWFAGWFWPLETILVVNLMVVLQWHPLLNCQPKILTPG